MKLKTTFLSTIICLLLFSFSASAQWCGTAANGKFEWRIETKTSPAQLIVTVHPLTLANSTFINFYPETLFGGGFGLTKSGADWVYTYNGSFTDGAELKLHFLYNGDGIIGQEQSETFTYAIGQDCLGSATNTKPVVEITGFDPGDDGLVSPATILLTATATDADGTINKVEFFNGTTSIGLGVAGTDNQYNLLWTNVNPGTYNNITAKATDDKLGATTSDPFPSFTVTGEFTNEWCGTSANGDYQWRAETVGTDVTFTIHPTNTVATGINNLGNPYGPGPYAIIYPYSAYMEPVSGTNDLTYTATGIASGTNIEFYVTYNYYGGENNSSANKEHYTSGTLCAMSTLPVSLTDFRSKAQTDGTVALTWATTSENNNNHFVIERSSDNSSFVTLANVASKGTNSQNRLNYSFTDKNPANGTNYYRLSQVDNNGTVLVLGVVAETVSLNSLSAVYPNPLHGNTLNLSLAGQQDGQIAVDISTLAGKVIYSGTTQIVAGQGSVSLSSKPVPGLYLVKAGDRSFKLVVE